MHGLLRLRQPGYASRWMVSLDETESFLHDRVATVAALSAT